MNYSGFFRVFSCVVLIIGLSPELFSQLYRPSTIVAPSPTAASIGKYGNINVSYYNGSPDISIPLYEVNTLNHKLNVNLRYDASGTKVLQDASWVGLGWTLNAGGAITRTVRQQDDFIEHGYYFSQHLPANDGPLYHYSPSTAQADKFYFDDVYSGQMDSEPDVFNYNFAGRRGKFILGKNIDNSIVYLDEQNDIEFVYTSGKWVATDGNGLKFYFGTTERTQDYNRSSNTALTNFNGVEALNFNYNSSPNTAWYIDSIVAPTAEKIVFEYVFGKSLSLVSESEIYCKLANIQILEGCTAQVPTGFSNDYRTYDASRQAIRDVYLKKISFINGSVEFKLSERSDITYLPNNDGLLLPSKLDSIIIKDINGNSVKGYRFFYTYFNSSDANGRLKLDSLAEFGKDGLTKPPYAFTYINPNSLPQKYTKSIDHWGYYNGANNTTLLPSYADPGASLPFVGADREPDTINNYLMNGVMSSIRYPTGGKTSFEYELHDYSNLHGEQAYKTVNKFAFVRSNPDINPGGDVYDVTFRIPGPPPGMVYQKTPVTTTCSYQKVDPNVSDLVSLGYSNLWLLENGNQYIKAGCTTANYNEPNPSPTSFTYMLDSGTYKMHIQSTRGWSFYMSASWQEKEPYPLIYRKGGGLRVKKITDEDLDGKKSVRRLIYRQGDSTSYGVLMSTPIYSYNYQVGGSNYIVGSGTVIPCSYVANFYGLSSSPIIPPGFSSNSGVVGYSKVVELQGENGENGRTEYYFNNSEELTDSYPFMPSISHPLNGRPYATIIFNAQGDTLKRTDYTYSVKERTSCYAAKLFTAPTVTGAQFVYAPRFYENPSFWTVTESEKETLYTPSGKISTTKKYTYNNTVHRQITQIEENRSDGSNSITKFKRPNDYTVSGNLSFVEQLRNNHIILPVIEEQILIQRGTSTKLVAGTFTSYKKYNNKFFKPEIVYNIETASPLDNITESSFNTSGVPVIHPNYKAQAYFDAYGSFGNLLSFHEINNINQSYIWGYQSQYPVAKVMGADYNTAIQGLNLSLIDNPVTDLGLRAELNKIRTNIPGSLVNTYTFSPLIGMTSETTPNGITTYYEYDSFGRLKLVKDRNGKIVKQIEYQYQRPLNQ